MSIHFLSLTLILTFMFYTNVFSLLDRYQNISQIFLTSINYNYGSGLKKTIEIYYREVWILGLLIHDIHLSIITKFVKLSEYHNYIAHSKTLFSPIVNLDFLSYINQFRTCFFSSCSGLFSDPSFSIRVFDWPYSSSTYISHCK